ncbi:MAG: undecaprenyldiphospho-muramoylpentapeptide beta-N-acetylglucosaminyltransferase [Campylobacterota bacterium]|nr:undecaprenyldiphospho-muramoylpentapeptide beta-N-acetylglucosaminyltransferase [Campylobacterota bacterium]
MKILITGGGTGGHLAIARALKEAAIKAGHICLYVGSRSGQDQAWFEEDNEFQKRYFLNTTGVVNKHGLRKFGALWQVFKAFFKVLKIMRHEKIDAVVSVGGFSAAPASFAAEISRVPFYIHEQNAVEGRLNKLLKPYSCAFFSSYDENSPLKDYPVSEQFFKNARIRTEIKTIVFLGGSQGARFINDLALELSPIVTSKGIHVIHQCGEADYQRVQKVYYDQGIDVELYSFSLDMPALLERSDLAISRAGASTLWELCATGLPAFFIPYPYAAGDHQYFNAEFLRKQDLAWCERQSITMSRSIITLLHENIEAKSRGVQNLIVPEGADKIINYIEESKC